MISLSTQNKALRIVPGVRPRTNAENLYNESDILSFERLDSYTIGTLMYKFPEYVLPELIEFFINVATIHEHDTRSARLNHIYMIFKGTTRCQKAFNQSGIHI